MAHRVLRPGAHLEVIVNKGSPTYRRLLAVLALLGLLALPGTGAAAPTVSADAPPPDAGFAATSSLRAAVGGAAISPWRKGDCFTHLWAIRSTRSNTRQQDSGRASGVDSTLILADPADPYYPLAEEIALAEGVPIATALDEALAAQPAFLLWVVSPGRLSERTMVDFGLAMREQPKAISTGIISGMTVEEARALWQRAVAARGEPAYAVNAANPAGNIEAGITLFEVSSTERLALTKENLVDSLTRAGYLTYTGHGGYTFLRLDEDTTLRGADLPDLAPVVVATGSCNTLQPWQADSIALAFVQQGAAAYAGFSFSPNEGYLMGEFDGLPFRYTWPDFPIGHVIQAQNRGTIQGFASLPYYHLLGDPRLALQTEAPYRLEGVETGDGSEVRHYADAPAGLIPVRVPGGARYSFVQVPGVGMAWRGEPFYNARLQMIDVGEDKYLLVEQAGGAFSLHLRARLPLLLVASDVILDALDGTLIYLQDHGGAEMMLGAGLVALAAAAVLVVRRKNSRRAVLPAALTGLAFALAHGLYGLVRVDQLSISSKYVQFGLLAPLATFLLVACGAFFTMRATSWRGRLVALVIACLGALAPAVFLLLILGVADNLIMVRELGSDLWNSRLGLQPLIAFVLGVAILTPVFYLVRKSQR